MGKRIMDKKKIICDTNIFIQVLSGDNKIISAVEFIKHENILMTSITALGSTFHS